MVTPVLGGLRPRGEISRAARNRAARNRALPDAANGNRMRAPSSVLATGLFPRRWVLWVVRFRPSTHTGRVAVQMARTDERTLSGLFQ